MASIFPDNGVAPALANNAYDPVHETPQCPAKYYPNDCSQPLDIDALNAIISEMSALKDCFGNPWDCSKLTNLRDEICGLKAPCDYPIQPAITTDPIYGFQVQGTDCVRVAVPNAVAPTATTPCATPLGTYNPALTTYAFQIQGTNCVRVALPPPPAAASACAFDKATNAIIESIGTDPNASSPALEVETCGYTNEFFVIASGTRTSSSTVSLVLQLSTDGGATFTDMGSNNAGSTQYASSVGNVPATSTYCTGWRFFVSEVLHPTGGGNDNLEILHGSEDDQTQTLGVWQNLSRRTRLIGSMPATIKVRLINQSTRVTATTITIQRL